jgi:ABC-type uncharacterized transport system auxiliary subunit
MMECRSKILLLPLVLVIIALTASACMRTPSGSKPMYYYTLEYAPRPERFPRPLPCVLRVERFTATPPFNTQRIIYADKGLHRNAYAYFQWIAPPGELLAFALSRDLRQTQGFQAVWTPDGASPATHIVTGWVEEFIEEDFSQPAQASLRLSIALIDARQSDPVQRILFQKTYSAKAACDDRTPAALSVAMSTATAQISAAIAEDIYRNLTPRN